ncbi:MAG: tripartite tricarboxylate transporter substrate-binding protein, partial [Vicinamibacterales bacterium]|nr:tripartite tricarboxylate transporter substrate-binding protein [Vicinamibacterales bacterium]
MASPLRSAALVLLLAGSLAACAGDDRRFPNRPVLLVCPWAAGGGTDRVARQLAVGLERELGVPVNVVNVTGASGVNGHTRGALARADGYTLTLMTAELNMLHWRGLTSITPGDFRPVGLLNRDPAAIFVRKDAPWRTLDDLNGHVRARPRTLRASGTALGGIWHIALGAWLTAA